MLKALVKDASMSAAIASAVVCTRENPTHTPAPSRRCRCWASSLCAPISYSKTENQKRSTDSAQQSLEALFMLISNGRQIFEAHPAGQTGLNTICGGSQEAVLHRLEYRTLA